MSFQAYLDTIKKNTGLGPADFRSAAEAKGLLAADVKTGAIVAWLAEDYGLGRGHAMAIVATLRPTAGHQDPDAAIAKQFAGAKAAWRPVYESLLEALRSNGEIAVAPTSTYISLLKGKAKFAIVAVTADRLDLGIKLKGEAPTDRFEAAGSWNSMVTHRVRIGSSEQIDAEVLDWLARAYAAA